MQRHQFSGLDVREGFEDIVNPNPAVISQVFPERDFFPNSPLPLVIYKGAFTNQVYPDSAEKLAIGNDWARIWFSTMIYNFPHYHSTAHEALAVLRGIAEIRFGNSPDGEYELCKGDLVIIPAGVSHEPVKKTDDFFVMGAYPAGQDWDLLKGESVEEMHSARETISRLFPPRTDPVYGVNGPIKHYWKIP